jgi:hypothetical protein
LVKYRSGGEGRFDGVVFHVSKNNIVMDTTALEFDHQSVFRSECDGA